MNTIKTIIPATKTNGALSGMAAKIEGADLDGIPDFLLAKNQPKAPPSPARPVKAPPIASAPKAAVAKASPKKPTSDVPKGEKAVIPAIAVPAPPKVPIQADSPSLSDGPGMARLRAAKSADAIRETVLADQAKAAVAISKPKAKASAPTSGKYNWTAAENAAKKGTIPPLPKFSAYGPYYVDIQELAKKKDAKGLKDYGATFKNREGGRANLFRYLDLCLLAIKG